ncbi:MAG: hypothetical protein Q7R47_05660, partial [Candidatus Diapherotrites archaeon]|nr:hypothetical protein [Candidatus Diapherotrites archaeon]
RMEEHGFVQANELEYRAKGSLQLGYRIADYARKPSHAIPSDRPTGLSADSPRSRNARSQARPEVNVNFCSAANKSFLQVGERMKRRAKTNRKAFEIVNEDGMIEKFVVEGPALTLELAEQLVAQFGRQIHYNAAKNRLETDEKTAKTVSKKSGLDYAFVTEMPSFDGWDVEKIPLTQIQINSKRT